ncbi:MAG: sulfotransferase family protein [Planctomycetota bacterium]
MRSFNKVFVIALPRCATVSMCDALGVLGIRTAHLGRIYGEDTLEHNNPDRLRHMHDQITKKDFDFEILKQCDGLADYPACSFDVLRELDRAYPQSLFINVRRDRDIQRWLQSIERQFVGLQLLRAGEGKSADDSSFMKTILSFRKMTFGQSDFEAEAYHRSYQDFQSRVKEFFSGRASMLLSIADISELETSGFRQICEFLECEVPISAFPRSNKHSELPSQFFMEALAAGQVESQTGIQP